jgi:glyoxylase I family protein
MNRRFDHIALTVTNIERSVSFYSLLGFVRVTPEPVDVDTAWIKTMTGIPDAHLQVQNLELGQTTLELLHYVRPKTPAHADMPLTSAGAAHVAVAMDDVYAEFKRLSAVGVKFRSEPITVPQGLSFAGFKAVYGFDPDGYTFEILQPPK